MASSRHVLETIGPLDEQLYNHNLDLDHCLKAEAAGYRNFLCSDSVAFHWHSQSGSGRYARMHAAEAVFWSRWGTTLTVDLGRYIDEALDVELDEAPHLAAAPFTLLDLTRSADQPIALDRLEARWPGIAAGVESRRQMHNGAPQLWLPVLLPHWLATSPRPFIYLVDSFQELVENALWFQRRARIVQEELVVDMSANVQRTSVLFPTRPSGR